MFPDIINTGDIYVPDESHVAVNDDLVIARSFADLEAYCEQYQFLWGTEDKSPYIFFLDIMGIERTRRDFFFLKDKNIVYKVQFNSLHYSYDSFYFYYSCYEYNSI